jgi:hypothetical protein
MMDEYHSLDDPDRTAGSRLEFWDLLSVLALILALGVAAFMVTVFMYPISINPFPARNPYAEATFTATPIQLEPTWTPTGVPFQTPTETLRPTLTPLPSPTTFSLLPPSRTPTATRTPKTPYSATVNHLQSDITVPHLQAAACNWQGVAGSVVDSSSSDIIGVVVRLAGSYGGKSVDMVAVSGLSPDYGRSGFEFVWLHPVASRAN